MIKANKERPYVGIGIMILRDGKVLLGERIGSHGANTLCIPGGHLEFGETILDCAKRETKEETGLDIEVSDVVCVNNDIVYDKHYISIGVIASSQDGDPQSIEPDKTQNWKWYEPTKVPEPIFIPSKRVIDAWLSGQFCNEI